MRRLAAVASLLLLVGASCAPAQSTLNSPFTQPTANTPPSAADRITMPSTANVPEFPGVLPAEERRGKRIRISTEKGDIVFDLYSDEAPIAASNFLWLTRHGFYDGLTFHRVEPGFVIQGGDPDGDGTGGPPWRFRDEPVTRPYLKGTVAMANAGPDTNGSQFFVMLEDWNVPGRTLPPNYTIFGQVVSGMEVVEAIRRGDAMTAVTVEDAR